MSARSLGEEAEQSLAVADRSGTEARERGRVAQVELVRAIDGLRDFDRDTLAR
jgi:hypothetical protein